MEWRPTTAKHLPSLLAEYVVAALGKARPTAPYVVLVDGPAATRPGRLAIALAKALTGDGRPAIGVDTALFLRDASVRLEYGHEDAYSFRFGWFDIDALFREVIAPLRIPMQPDASLLTALRDPDTNRSLRGDRVPVDPTSILVIGGELLRDVGLTGDLDIFLQMSRGARERRTPEDYVWTLTAVAEYESEHDPASLADIVVASDHPERPAVRGPLG